MTQVEAITIETGGHVVHFYEDEGDLITTLSHYVAAAVGVGDASLIIATSDHREAVAAHLEVAGIDVAEARRNGTFVTMDAAAALSQFYAGGQIDARRFRAVIGGAIRHIVQETGRPVRCYGEMVLFLWNAGTVTAAIELEGLWNDLAGELDFSLLCSYPSQSVAGPEHVHARWELRQAHSDVCDTHPGAERHFRPHQPGAAEMPLTFDALTELFRLNLADEIHQATGFVAVELGVNLAEALNWLRFIAAERDVTLDEVAEEIVSRMTPVPRP